MKLNLSPAAQKAKAAYQRQWITKNRDKQHEYIRRFWEKKAREMNVTGNVTDSDTDKITVTTCQQCGEPFKPKRSDARFCSDNCRVQYNRKRTKGSV